jgi:hypothetical protein
MNPTSDSPGAGMDQSSIPLSPPLRNITTRRFSATTRRRSGWKTLADIWRADPPRPVVVNTSSGTAGPEPRAVIAGRNGMRSERYFHSEFRLVSSHFACCKRFASSRSCPTIAVRRRWTALARSGYLIRDLTNPCQPTAYLCPKAEDGNRRKNVLQRARQRNG